MKNITILSLITAVLSLFGSCKNATGDKASISEAATVVASTGQTLAVDVSQSIINWEGAKPTGTHTGTISLTEGEVVIKDRTIAGGSFTVDMNSIVNTDLDGDSKTNLESHLKGFAEGKEDHFFNVAQYPTGRFEITRVQKVNGNEEVTHMIYGNLTLKGISREIGFRALVGIGRERIEVSTPPFTIDRTVWGVNYGSKTVFDDLGEKFINDEIGLSIRLKAGKDLM